MGRNIEYIFQEVFLLHNNLYIFLYINLKKKNGMHSTEKCIFHMSAEIELQYFQNTSSIEVQPLVAMFFLKTSSKCLL